MIVMPVGHDLASLRDGAAAGQSRRATDRPAQQRQPATASERLQTRESVDAQLDSACRRLALWTALLGVFGTLAGAWLGATLQKQSSAAQLMLTAQTCLSAAEPDPFNH